MLDLIKKALRFTGTELDDDIQYNIDACLLELERVGIAPDVSDKLVCKAVELFCKWQYDFLQKGEQYHSNYDALRDSMSLCARYKDE